MNNKYISKTFLNKSPFTKNSFSLKPRIALAQNLDSWKAHHLFLGPKIVNSTQLIKGINPIDHKQSLWSFIPYKSAW